MGCNWLQAVCYGRGSIASPITKLQPCHTWRMNGTWSQCHTWRVNGTWLQYEMLNVGKGLIRSRVDSRNKVCRQFVRMRATASRSDSKYWKGYRQRVFWWDNLERVMIMYFHILQAQDGAIQQGTKVKAWYKIISVLPWSTTETMLCHNRTMDFRIYRRNRASYAMPGQEAVAKPASLRNMPQSHTLDRPAIQSERRRAMNSLILSSLCLTLPTKHPPTNSSIFRLIPLSWNLPVAASFSLPGNAKVVTAKS